MPMTIPFERGQRFHSAEPGEENVIVQVIAVGGSHRPGEIFVGTERNTDGKLIRQRWAKTDRFHDRMTLPVSGRRRTTGWVLVQS